MKRLLFLICVTALFLFFPLSTHASEYSNTSHDWYFKKAKDHQPATTEPEFAELLKKYGGVFQGNTEQKIIYMTFDNGYEEGYTDEFLDVLQEKHVPAAFFV